MNQNLPPAAMGNPSAARLGGLQMRQRWDGLGLRERRLVLIAGALVAAALLWWIALAPALATLRLAQDQHPRLDAQLQQMQTLKAQAGALAAQPKVLPDDARRSLETSLKQTLGASAQMAVAANRATVTLKGAAPDALAQWLMQARINARAAPAEVRLIKSASASPSASSGAGFPASQLANAPSATSANPAVALTPAPTRWDGTVVLNLPER